MFKYFKENNLIKSFITALLLKCEVYFWISQKPPIRFGMMDYNTNLNGDLLKCIESFSLDRYHRVALNEQIFKMKKTKTWFPEGFILVPLFFLIYTNDLPSELCCSAKLFYDDKTLFSVVKVVNEIATKLNEDLENIGKWVNQRCILILTKRKWKNKFYFQGKTFKLPIATSFLLKKKSRFLISNTPWSSVTFKTKFPYGFERKVFYYKWWYIFIRESEMFYT